MFPYYYINAWDKIASPDNEKIRHFNLFFVLYFFPTVNMDIFFKSRKVIDVIFLEKICIAMWRVDCRKKWYRR